MQPDNSSLVEQLAAIRQLLAALHEQLVFMGDQQKTMCTLLAQLQPRPPAFSAHEPVPTPAATGAEVLADCAQDLLRVLREVGHPLTKLEILEEMVNRQLRWSESTVSHTLVNLMDHGLIRDSGDGGPRRYGLSAAR